MPYGLALDIVVYLLDMFQSLIWVACPTGTIYTAIVAATSPVSIPHMGCMPYGRDGQHQPDQDVAGFNPSYGLHALRAFGSFSTCQTMARFNPSYGLHALRAHRCADRVAPEYPRFNPSYGLHALRAVWES